MQKAFILLVAACALMTATADAHCNYLVKEGDNLSQLAEDYNVNETVLVELNPQVVDPELIYVGDVIKIPCEGGDDTSGNSITDLLTHRTDLNILLTALAKVGLAEELDNGDLEWTLFAPTDAAFAKLLSALNLSAAQLLNDTELVTNVLTYHVLPRAAFEADDFNSRPYNTLLPGAQVEMISNDTGVFIGTVAGQEVQVAIPNLQAGDSVVHIIEDVLLPLPSGEEAEEAPATPAPIAAPTPTPTNCVYVVKQGDSLFDIGQQFDATVEELVELNPGLEDPELILPGQELNVC